MDSRILLTGRESINEASMTREPKLFLTTFFRLFSGLLMDPWEGPRVFVP